RELVGVGGADPTEVGDRDGYYSHLFELRDGYAGNDLQIQSLAGRTADYLEGSATNSLAWRYALLTLSPFVALGGTFDSALMSLSSHWVSARADFLAHLLHARALDHTFELSGTSENELFVDVDRGETLAAINAAAVIDAPEAGVESLDAYLSALTYGSKTAFGSDNPAAPDSMVGTAGE